MGLIDEGYTSVCADNQAYGGVKRLYIANKDDVTSFNAAAEHSYNTVSYSGTAQFFEFEPLKYTATTTEEGTSEEETYVSAVTIEAFFKRQERSKAEALNALTAACGLVCVTLNWNGQFQVYGYDETLTNDAYLMAALSGGIEAALQSRNGYTLTLTGTMAEIAREYTGTVASLTP